VFLFHKLPLAARPTYFHGLRAAILMGFRAGIVGLATLVARKSLNAPDWQLAILATASYGSMALSFWWARLAAEHRKMPMVVIPLLVSQVLVASVAFVTGSMTFIVLASLSSLADQISMPASSTITRLNYPPTHRGTILGFIQARTLVVTAVVSALAGYVLRIDAAAYRYLFPAAAAFGVLGTLRYASIRVRGEAHGVVRSESPGLRAMLGILRKDRRFRQYMLSFFISGFGNIMTMPLLVLVITDDLHMPYDRAAWVVSTIPFVLMALTAGLWGRLIDRSNPVSSRAWMATVGAFECFTVFVSAVTGSAVPMYAGKVVAGLVGAGSGLLWSLGINYFSSKRNVPLYMGIHLVLTGIRWVIAPTLGIVLARWSMWLGPTIGGPRYVFAIAGAMWLLAGLIMYQLALRERADGRFSGFADAEAAADGPHDHAESGRETPGP